MRGIMVGQCRHDYEAFFCTVIGQSPFAGRHEFNKHLTRGRPTDGLPSTGGRESYELPCIDRIAKAPAKSMGLARLLRDVAVSGRFNDGQQTRGPHLARGYILWTKCVVFQSTGRGRSIVGACVTVSGGGPPEVTLISGRWQHASVHASFPALPPQISHLPSPCCAEAPTVAAAPREGVPKKASRRVFRRTLSHAVTRGHTLAEGGDDTIAITRKSCFHRDTYF